MLKRIKIQGYKSLVDVEVELQPLTVLFGPNAAGKSNFLDALQLLSRLTASGSLRNAFAPPYRGSVLESFTFGPEGIAGLLKQEKVSFSIEADIEPSSESIARAQAELKNMGQDEYDNLNKTKLLKYFIKIEVEPKSGILQRTEYSITAFDIAGLVIGWIDPTPSRRGRRTFTMHETNFIALFQEELRGWHFLYLEPRERMRQPAPVKEAYNIGPMGEDIGPFLNTLHALNEPQFKAIGKALHLLIPEITDIDVGVDAEGNIKVRLMQGETPLPASILSDGTWRILGLLALGSSKEPPALLGLEEPETGINAQRLDLIASLLTSLTHNGIQVIMTTHSPALLDELPRESLYVVQQRAGKTSIKSLTRFDKFAPDRLISERLLRGDFNV